MYLCCWLSLFEVYGRVGKSAIWVLKEPKGQTNAFHGCGKKKSRDLLGFVMHSYLKEGTFTAVIRNVKN